MEEAIKLAKELGCKRLMLGTIEGNERAIRLYQKFGFRTEAFEDGETYIDGTWRRHYIMGLDLVPCEPKLDQFFASRKSRKASSSTKPYKNMCVRQLVNSDLDELNRLQNCPESTKSSYRIPPTTKEETKQWYEALNTEKEKYCLACFADNKLLGYLQFRTYRLPFPCLKFEEIIVDVKNEPHRTAKALILELKNFMERYWFQRIFAYVPETSLAIISALEENGFSKTGAMKSYYYIDGCYVNVSVYEYPSEVHLAETKITK